MVTSEVLRKLPGYRELDLTRFPPIALIGYNGTGKTYLAASATKVPELCPVCLIAIAKTDATLIGKKDIDASQLVLLDPREHMAKAHISNMWDATKQTLRSMGKLKPFPFRTVILDGISQMQYWAEARAVEQTPFHPDGGSVLLELTQQGDYRLAKDRMMGELLSLLDVCDANKAAFILTGQERLLQIIPEGEIQADEKGNQLKTYRATIALMPSLIQDVLGLMTVVGRMRVAGGKFIMETRRSQYLDAKDQTGYLEDRTEMPTMAGIYKKLTEGGLKLGRNGTGPTEGKSES